MSIRALRPWSHVSCDGRWHWQAQRERTSVLLATSGDTGKELLTRVGPRGAVCVGLWGDGGAGVELTQRSSYGLSHLSGYLCGEGDRKEGACRCCANQAGWEGAGGDQAFLFHHQVRSPPRSPLHPPIAPFFPPRLCSACGWEHGHGGVSVLLLEQSWLNTKKSRLLCLFSGPLVTGLHSAHCSQGKAARRNAIQVWTTLVVQESPGRLGGPSP